MKQKSWLELSEYAALAGCGIGTIATALFSKAIYAAAPLTLALSLNLLNRQRFQKQVQEDTTKEIADLQTAIEERIKALPPPPEPVNLSPIEWKITNLGNQLDTLNHEFQNRPEKRAIAKIIKRIGILHQQFQARPEIKEIAQISEHLALLTRNFNNRVETEIILQISEQLNTLAQQFYDRPETRAISQLRQKLELLNQRFDGRGEIKDILRLREEITLITQHFFRPTEMQQITEIKQHLELLSRRFDNRIELEEVVEIKQRFCALELELNNLSQEYKSQGSIKKLKLIIRHINNLTEKFNKRPEKLVIAQIKQDLDIVTQQVNSFVLTEAIDAIEIEGAIAQHNNQIYNLKKQVDTLTQEFHNRPEKQAISSPIEEVVRQWSRIGKED